MLNFYNRFRPVHLYFIMLSILLFSDRYQWPIERWYNFEDLTQFDSIYIARKHSKPIWNLLLNLLKTDNKINSISTNFDPSNFQLYMRVGTHLWHDNLKGQLLQPTVYRETHLQNSPIICCTILLKTIKNMIFMNTDPNGLQVSKYILFL